MMVNEILKQLIQKLIINIKFGLQFTYLFYICINQINYSVVLYLHSFIVIKYLIIVTCRQNGYLYVFY